MFASSSELPKERKLRRSNLHPGTTSLRFVKKDGDVWVGEEEGLAVNITKIVLLSTCNLNVFFRMVKN